MLESDARADAVEKTSAAIAAIAEVTRIGMFLPLTDWRTIDQPGSCDGQIARQFRQKIP